MADDDDIVFSTTPEQDTEIAKTLGLPLPLTPKHGYSARATCR